MTDDRGRFAFSGLTAGSYAIQAQGENFLYEPSAKALTLESGEIKNDLVLQLTPLGAIAGRVKTEEGDALPGVSVAALTYVNGPVGRRLAASGKATTNDLGEYRLSGLTAGSYVIRTAQRDGTILEYVYASTYYPEGTDSSLASVLELKPGRELTGIDFVLRRTRTASLHGRITTPPNAAAVKASIRLDSVDQIHITDAESDEQGNFDIRGLPPGSYILTASAAVGETTYMTQRTVQAAPDDVQRIQLHLLPPADLNGVLRIEGATTVRPSQVTIEMRAPRQAAVRDDGTFAIRDAAPLIQRPVVRGPRTVFVKSIRCGTVDVTVSGIDLSAGGGCDLVITLSANGGRVEGAVLDDSGNPAPGRTVTLSPQSPARTDLFRSTTSDANGRFALVGVAPGAYRIYAWETVDITAVQYSPDFARRFEPLGRSLDIGEGSRETIDLKQIGRASVQ